MAKKLSQKEFRRAAICFECGGVASQDRLHQLLADEEERDVLKYWSDQFNIEPEEIITIEDLQTKEEVHFVAGNFNWDSNYEALFARINHSLCDAGTGLLLYWFGTGYYSMAKNDPKDPLLPLFSTIQDRFISNKFNSYQIAFDPYEEQLVPELSEVLETNFHIPTAFFAPYSTMYVEYSMENYPKHYFD